MEPLNQFIVTEDESVVIDELDGNGLTPLLWAASYGQLPTGRLLITKGADPHISGKHGETALLLAAANGHVHVLKELIGHGVNVNQTDEVCLKLIEFVGNFQCLSQKDANSALMFAAFGNHALCANELLKAGADITLENSNLDTVFSIAVKKRSKQG